MRRKARLVLKKLRFEPGAVRDFCGFCAGSGDGLAAFEQKSVMVSMRTE
ncbi:MAG: hypothetical protein IPJ07_20550 [Acidobacteria bacterium]|nr:hypothetical protein [Acidobacteriota bacterium]